MPSPATPSTRTIGLKPKAHAALSPTRGRSNSLVIPGEVEESSRIFLIFAIVMGKLLYTMGEVAQELGENPSAVRYWSNYFEKFIKPQRNAKGNRLFHPEDIETLKQIQFLVKKQGLTLEGAAQRLKDERRSVEARVKALNSLKDIRTLLTEVRAGL